MYVRQLIQQTAEGFQTVAVMRFLRIFFLIGVLAPAGFLFCCGQYTDISFQHVNIAIDPPTVNFTSDQAEKGEYHVTVTCRSSYFIAALRRRYPANRLSIFRRFGNGTERQYAQASSGHKDGAVELIDGYTPPGASGSGSLKEGIVLHHTRVTCRDGGGFFCKGSYQSDKKESETVNVTVNVTPGQLTLTPSPREKTQWQVGEVLTMTCQGPLGSVGPNDQVDWVWQYRYTEPHDTDWVIYNKGVETGPVEGTGNPCIKRGSSTVKRRLSLKDTNRQYRCFVKKRGGVSFLEYAAVHDVGVVLFSDGKEHYMYLAMGFGVGGFVAVGFAFVLWVQWRCRVSSMTDKRMNNPLLPRHRDPSYYYGEYLEPRPQVLEQEAYTGLQDPTNYSEFSIYEDIDSPRTVSAFSAKESKQGLQDSTNYSEFSIYEDIDNPRTVSAFSAKESKQVETSGPGANTEN
ncbi:uncharacterized protein LOC143291469 isoform X3 [Babylonia areolata]|uniref:uncharacterized protein LOC143291469 isoform X3 n=1 Tax=Babylonia areolata TaxID=304850 RepID=UPI003FCF8F65